MNRWLAVGLVLLGFLATVLGQDRGTATMPTTTPATQTTRAATATRPVVTLASVLTRFPAAMRPKYPETGRQQATREEWLKAEAVGRRVTAVILYGESNKMQGAPAWLSDSTVRPDGVQIAITMRKGVEQPKYFADDIITVEGTVKLVFILPSFAAVELADCMVTKVQPAKPK